MWGGSDLKGEEKREGNGIQVTRKEKRYFNEREGNYAKRAGGTWGAIGKQSKFGNTHRYYEAP